MPKYFNGNTWEVTENDFARCLNDGWGCFHLDYDFTIITIDDIHQIFEVRPLTQYPTQGPQKPVDARTG